MTRRSSAFRPMTGRIVMLASRRWRGTSTLRTKRGSGAGAGARLHPRVPGADILQVRVERLADPGKEIDKGKEQDIGERKALAAHILLAGHQPIEPGEPLLRDLLQVAGGLRDAMDAGLEHPQPLAKAEAVSHRLEDVEVD